MRERPSCTGRPLNIMTMEVVKMSKFYTTDKPCKYGHVAPRYRSTRSCVSCASTASKTWSKDNSIRTKEIKRKCYIKHRTNNLEYAKQYNQDNPKSEEQVIAKAIYDRSYNKKNASKILARGAVWRRQNVDRVRITQKNYSMRRRAQESGGISTAELIDWTASQPKICYWCGKKCPKTFHVDHYHPLSKGGKHEADNLVISCPTCNLTKSAKDPYEFAKSVGRLF